MQLISELYIKLVKNLTINKIKYIFIIFSLSPFLILLVIIKPIIFIRFGNLACERIGNFSAAEGYLLNKKLKKNRVRSLDIWMPGVHLSNKQMLIILKRKLLIIQHLFIFYKVLELISKYIHIYSKHIIEIDKPYYKNRYLFNKYPSQLNLTRQEISKGELILKQFGIPKNAKIICITIRDSLYLRRIYPTRNFSYHNYRNTDANNFISTIKALIKKNFFVVRMGQIAIKKINIRSSKFIDYPFHPLKSDFMDFFFAYKCYFWIGNNTGLDEVARTFRKPLLLMNLAPLMSLHHEIAQKKRLVCIKPHINSKNKKLSLSEIFEYGVADSFRGGDFKKKKVKLKELNPKQIKNIVLEMLKLMRDSWKIKNKKDIELQRKFKKLYLKKMKELHSTLHYLSEISYSDLAYRRLKIIYSMSFLKKNRWFLN